MSEFIQSLRIESERLSPALLDRAMRAAYRDRRAIGAPVPSEDELVAACPTCDSRGYYHTEWPEGVRDTGRCRHFAGILAVLVAREGIPAAALSRAVA